MQFSLYVSARPKPREQSEALKFAQAVMLQGHALYRVFFFDEGVLCASETAEMSGWVALGEDYQVDLCLCSASAARNKLVSSSGVPIAPKQFSVGGLVQLADAQAQSDRLVSFH